MYSVFLVNFLVILTVRIQLVNQLLLVLNGLDFSVVYSGRSRLHSTQMGMSVQQKEVNYVYTYWMFRNFSKRKAGFSL